MLAVLLLVAYSCGESADQSGAVPTREPTVGHQPPPPQTPSAMTPPPVMPPSGPSRVAAEPLPCTDPDAKLDGLRLVTVATAGRPTHLVGHPSDPDTVLIAERGGTVRVAKGLRNATTAVELSDPILTVQTTTGSERGLLSLAIHPDDPTRLYVFYNDGTMGNASVVQEFTRNLETGMATAGKELYRAAHQAGNHQGGQVAFGADKMLYFSIGDNGSSGGQETSLLLDNNFGKVLRIDPATALAPPGNHMGPIWSYGLRNPWRMSFDRKTGDLYIGDVGADVEEINFQRADQGSGTNYGWSGGGEGAGAPVYAYDTRPDQNCVIGGYVYRGTTNGCMYGRYFFKDRRRRAAQSFVVQNGTMTDLRTHMNLAGGNDLYSFGEDGAGELYMLDGSGNAMNGGRIVRIVE